MVQNVLVILFIGILGILGGLFLILCINLLTFYRLRGEGRSVAGRPQGYAPTERRSVGAYPCGRPATDLPILSILLPARNEEHCIASCVRSLIEQSYEPLEVLVLDDNSSDATEMIVQHMIDELPAAQKGRLRLLHGEPLPPGWIGKNFACHQLAQHAQGDYLFFTDADTVHVPETARAVIDCMHTFGVKMLTAQPEHVVGSLGERFVVPLLNFTILTLLPVALIPQRPEPSLATGNGQLLCFHHSAYEAVGGHEAVKGRVLEDVLLARAVKAAGYRIMFVDALELVRCRMYRSFADVWAGFSKNLFAFYNYSLPFALIALILNLLLFVMPPLILFVSLVIPVQFPILLDATSAYLLTVLMRVCLTLRFTRSQRGLMLLLCLLHPVSIMLECLILLNSMRWYYGGTGIVWKGRQYSGTSSSNAHIIS